MLTESKDGFSITNGVNFDLYFLLKPEMTVVDWSNKLSVLCLKAKARVLSTKLISK